MKVTYDGVGDTLSILLSKKQIAYAEEHGAVIVNYDRNDKPAEIEILNASKFMGDLLSTMIKAKTRKTTRNNRLTAVLCFPSSHVVYKSDDPPQVTLDFSLFKGSTVFSEQLIYSSSGVFIEGVQDKNCSTEPTP